MICQNCEETAELKTFDTFQYFYCSTCRKEVELSVVIPYSPPIESPGYIDFDLTYRPLDIDVTNKILDYKNTPPDETI